MPVVWLQRVPTGELPEVLPHSIQEVACQGELPTAFPHPLLPLQLESLPVLPVGYKLIYTRV